MCTNMGIAEINPKNDDNAVKQTSIGYCDKTISICTLGENRL